MFSINLGNKYLLTRIVSIFFFIFVPEKQLAGLSLIPLVEEESPGNIEHPTS